MTGRELSELQATFPDVGMCDVVVAENGGLLYWPQTGSEDVLAEPPAEEFIAEMAREGIAPFSVGRVIFATWRPHEKKVLDVIGRLGIGLQVIFNKRAVMVLPPHVNKATGLAAALARMQLSAEAVVAVGDAENDHAFLDACGVAVAVNNALPALKSRCDLVTSRGHGAGVVELIDQLLDDDLASLGPRRPRTKFAPRHIDH